MAADTTRHVPRPLAIVLGLNEIASAVAVNLFNAGYGVIMAHDPASPVIRRGMSFFDALFDGRAKLGGVTAVSVDSTLAARLHVNRQERISVTRLDLSELLIIGAIDVLIDARMQADAVTPQLRRLARFTIGIGNGFVSGEDCDAMVAVAGAEHAPSRNSESPGRKRVVLRTPTAGHWHTPLDIGTRIYKGFPLGCIGSTIVRAPCDGILRGIARDDTPVPGGAELIEILTYGGGRWWGLDGQGVRIGEKVQRALSGLGAQRGGVSATRLRLVHSR